MLKHKIALFDVVAESDIAGSADSSLEKSEFKICNMKFLFPPNTNIKKNFYVMEKLLITYFIIQIKQICQFWQCPQQALPTQDLILKFGKTKLYQK